jgi:predicted ester cyclase
VSTAQENKELILRFYREIDAGNIGAMDEMVADNYINHDPPPFPGLPTGREGLKQMFQMFWEATPGHHEIEDQIAEGDKVVTVLRGVGKHTGDLAGIPPSGNELNVKAVAVHRIDEGMIVEHWSAVDSAALLSQLGVIQLPTGP